MSHPVFSAYRLGNCLSMPFRREIGHQRFRIAAKFRRRGVVRHFGSLLSEQLANAVNGSNRVKITESFFIAIYGYLFL